MVCQAAGFRILVLSAVLASVGMPAEGSELVLSNRMGRVKVSPVGAQVVSYVPAGRQEVLFMPADADFSRDREMHGGIPVCWPWFGRMGAPGSRLHGLVRYCRWQVAEQSDGAEVSRLVLTLVSDEETRKAWPYDFRLTYTIELTDRLELTLVAENTGSRPFETTLGFHPYFRVRDPSAVVVEGLKKSLRAYPGIDGGQATESGGRYAFDSGYGPVEISADGERKLVVWNPGPEWPGFTPACNLVKEDWRRFLCVEPAVIGPENAVRLASGERHVFKMAIRRPPVATSDAGVVGVGVVIPEKDRTRGVILARDDVRLYCSQTNGWTFSLEQTTPVAGVRDFRLTLTSAVEALPPAFRFEVRSLKTDMQYAWTPAYGCAGRLSIPSWANWYAVSRQIPVVARFNGNDRNRIALATSETRREIAFGAGHSEDDFSCSDVIRFFEGVKCATKRYVVRFRVDRRDVFWSRAIEDAVAWVGETSGEREPCVPPESAYQPLYSTWYNFHQDICQDIIERELKIAADLGMKTVILDDGWQMDVAGRGYRYCGDWEVSKKRFPDMAGHVRRMHARGLKYMVWYSVPFVGYESKAYARFKDRLLYTDDRLGAGALDPRFPEVRAYLADIYERAVREWDIDGFKLDFIDQIETRDKPDPAIAQDYAGRDYRSIPDAVDRLLKDATDRLRAIKPDLMFEFRQAYIGPAIRQYGNMMRVGDCPTSLAANRVGTVNLRLMCPGSAVHGDMIKWTADDTPEQAARYVLSSIFGVVQYSAVLADLKPEHLKMIRHWIAFARQHETALLKGALTPYHAECDYPVVEETDGTERIVLVSSVGFVAGLKTDLPLFVLNNTGEKEILVEAPAPLVAEAFDTFGTSCGTVSIPAGISRVAVPVSGYLKAIAQHL